MIVGRKYLLGQSIIPSVTNRARTCSPSRIHTTPSARTVLFLLVGFFCLFALVGSQDSWVPDLSTPSDTSQSLPSLLLSHCPLSHYPTSQSHRSWREETSVVPRFPVLQCSNSELTPSFFRSAGCWMIKMIFIVGGTHGTTSFLIPITP